MFIVISLVNGRHRPKSNAETVSCNFDLGSSRMSMFSGKNFLFLVPSLVWMLFLVSCIQFTQYKSLIAAAGGKSSFFSVGMCSSLVDVQNKLISCLSALRDFIIVFPLITGELCFSLAYQLDDLVDTQCLDMKQCGMDLKLDEMEAKVRLEFVYSVCNKLQAPCTDDISVCNCCMNFVLCFYFL